MGSDLNFGNYGFRVKDISMSDVCPRDDIAAYVDGEVSAELSAELELHFAECEVCGRVLREQRQFLQALSASLANEGAIELPEDFTKKIVVTAESSVTGLRGKRELLTAALILAALLLFSIFVLGGEYLGADSSASGFGQNLIALGAMLVRSAAHAATAAAVVLKALANAVFGGPVLLLFGVGAAAVIFCSSIWVIRRRNA